MGWWSPEKYVEQNGGPYPASRNLEISFRLDQDALCLTWLNGSGNVLWMVFFETGGPPQNLGELGAMSRFTYFSILDPMAHNLFNPLNKT
ncbi:hypothetical protein [Sphingobacterium sp. 1.A.4]|uniref:hypothetical protein n=1 Tax=Sphingobacterium sp. 1.A.4 TaxID=2044603 RepID=UPI000C0BB996|nr:hypothetical protein [Sphingobacterium sp. 1.A.4]